MVGSFTSAFHTSSRRRATATAGSTRSSSMVVKSAVLMLWGPPLDPLNSLNNEPEESSWQEMGGEGMPEGAMTAIAICTDSVSRNRTTQEASTLIFVTSICGVVKRSSSAADASGSPSSAVETSQGCLVQSGDIVAISIVDDTLGAYEVVVGGTFSQAGGGGGAGGVQNTRAIALWNRGTWRRVGSVDGKGCVGALALLYSGGAWSELGGVSRALRSHWPSHTRPSYSLAANSLPLAGRLTGTGFLLSTSSDGCRISENGRALLLQGNPAASLAHRISLKGLVLQASFSSYVLKHRTSKA